MRHENAGWKRNWASFIQNVGESYDNGLDDAAVTARFARQEVAWQGKVAEKKLDDADDPGIQLDMPPVKIRRSDGRRATVDYLYLHLTPERAAAWRKVSLGSTVGFRGSVRVETGPFPGIHWADLTDSNGVILLGVDGIEPFDIDALSRKTIEVREGRPVVSAGEVPPVAEMP